MKSSYRTTHVAVGANIDLEQLYEQHEQGLPAGKWPVKKTASVGDWVVILLPALHGSFIGYGQVASEPERDTWGNSSRYFAPIEDFERISPPVPVQLMREQFSGGDWTNYPRTYTTVPDELVSNFWDFIAQAPVAADIESPADTKDYVVTRVIRDSAAARKLKIKYDFKCQVCNTAIQYGDTDRYAEVHHLRPLASSHGGSDTTANMLVLCPTHHAMFDLGVPKFVNQSTIRIGTKTYKLTQKHKLAKKNVEYYRDWIFRG